MSVALPIMLLGSWVILFGWGFLAGREKEKRDVLLAVEVQEKKYPTCEPSNVHPATPVYVLRRTIEEHGHRILGRRSHYDERKRQHPDPAS